jgi:hypothetical protein
MQCNNQEMEMLQQEEGNFDFKLSVWTNLPKYEVSYAQIIFSLWQWYNQYMDGLPKILIYVKVTLW